MTLPNIDRYPIKSRPMWGLAWLGALGLALIISVILAAALVLPPVSLLKRLDPAYTHISRDGGDVHDPDGTQLTFLPKHVQQAFWIKLSAVPRSSFLEGSAGSSLLTAASSLPNNLVMKSPFYRIEHSGAQAQGVILTLPIPNEAEPYQTLDLYTWDGQAWQWLPHRIILAEEVIEAELAYLPESVVVMQTHALQPAVSASQTLHQELVMPDNFENVVVELNPEGFYLESDGLIAGELGQLPVEMQNASVSVIPVVRNWSEAGSVRSDLIDNLLIDPEAQQRHVGAIVSLVQTNAYRGIELDYREINPALRQEYTALLEQLRAALPADKQLLVWLPLPRQLSAEAWDTGAYDWQAIGRLANGVKVAVAAEPQAYAPEGEMEAVLAWAVGQVNRFKLQLFLSTRSLEQVNGAPRELSYRQAVESLGPVAIVGGAATVSPGQEINFTLAGLPTAESIQFDSQSGLYRFTWPDSQRTLYLENAASIARKLQFVAQYHLRGVTVQGLFDPDSEAQVREVIHQFLNLIIPEVEGQQVVIWQVQNQEGGLIAQEGLDLNTPAYRWTAPPAGGSYQVLASISPNRDAATAIPLGSVTVVVTEPGP